MRSRFFIYVGMSVLAALFLSAAYFFYVINQPRKSLQDQEAVIEISAGKLFAEYQDDEQNANKKYLDKIIRVSGSVSEVKRNQANEINIVMQADDMFGVSCTFDMNSNDKDNL